MSVEKAMPDEIGVCLQSVYQAAQAGKTPAMAVALIDLLWGVSDARPDLEQLPLSISRSERRIRESGEKGDIVALGMYVKHILVESAANRLPKDLQDRMGCAVADMARAAEREDIAGFADAARGAVHVFAEQGQSTSGMRVAQDGNTIRIGRHFRVSFSRTLRVPDDGRTYPLPAGLGHFPLHSVADFADRVPSKWLDVGGFFLPMYQSEAMFLSLGGVTWRPNIVKVGVGKVNAVNGKPWDERIRAHEQDYLLCPEQRWLDGINAGNGFVRQFVAMPLGQGYTIEEQVTDEDRFGGIQLVVFEPRNGVFPEADPDEAARRAREATESTILLEGIGRLPEPFRSVLAMSALGVPRQQIAAVVSLPQDLVEQYEAQALETARMRATWLERVGYRDAQMMAYRAGEGKASLVEAIQREGIKRLEAAIGPEAASRLSCDIFGSEVRFCLADAEPRAKSGHPGVQMGLAAGGRIRQKVVVDRYGADTWDASARGSLWIHLANSAMYQEITGKRPPEKPLDAGQYQRLGIPWFSHYQEPGGSVSPSSILSRVKSVFALDRQRGQSRGQDALISVDPKHVHAIRVQSSTERITALLSAAEAAAGAGRHRSASRLASAALDLDPHDVRALCLHANALLRLGFHEQARDAAEAAIRLDSGSWPARRIRAEAVLRLGSPAAAFVEASVAFRLSGGDKALGDVARMAQATIRESKAKEPGK